MDSIEETPLKRQKTVAGDVSQSKTYESENDSGDELFGGNDTVETLPWHGPQQNSYVTQPTQIIGNTRDKINDGKGDAVVQVAGSSPLARVSSPPQKRSLTGGILASAIAPPGTAFRLPQGVTKAPPVRKPVDVQEISSDEDEIAKFRQHSSDEDTQSARRADIKPSTFKPSSNSKFKSALANASYQPAGPNNSTTSKGSFAGSVFDSRNRNEGQTRSEIPSAKNSSDVMANAYGSSRNARPPVARQPGPAKANPMQDMSLDEIRDAQIRSKIQRMRNILPGCSVTVCFNALLKKRANYDDAMDLLAATDGVPVDLTVSDGEDKALPSQQSQKKVPAKQQVKAPNLKIHEKWSATQPLSKSQQQPISPEVAEAPKPKRRLVQGRKRLSPISSPVRTQSPQPASPDQQSDSAIGTEPDIPQGDAKLLDFFNSCDAAQLTDTAAVSTETAALVLSKRPFKNLDEVREISEPEPTEEAKGKTKRKVKKKPIGDKIVERCSDMLTGYGALDQLAQECERIGESVREDMKSWGMGVFGGEGEVELADLDVISNTTRDSGIGTPTSRDLSGDEEIGHGIGQSGTRKKHSFFPQPTIMAEGVNLKDYQTVGINWLSLLFSKRLSGILADDMGLGKTCQVIAFLAHLLERKNVHGPHLIIVPASTLENWLREFRQFCPQLKVQPYYAGHKERPELREQIEDNIESLNVLVTTYTIAKSKDDNKFLRRLKPVCTVYDEGHILRNSKSAGYEMYMRIPCEFRLLLTGTPLQNNLAELASLLGFILPSMFSDYREDLEAIFNHKAKTTEVEESHAALLSTERINRAKRMMTPFVLRRKKHQVLKYLPKKHRRVQHCELSESQRVIYEDEKMRALKVITAREAGERVGNETSNVMMSLRKASLHPLLFRRHYNDDILAKMAKACLKEEEFHLSNPDLVFEDMTVMTDMELHQFCERYPSTMARFRLKNEEWMDSGKVQALTHLLLQYKANGDRVLVFSQFVMVLNILEAVLETLEMQFFRLDGSTKIEERQEMLDQFYKEPEITVFLLSTGAGGAGINLACANKVVIFDSSFNPQMDIQAENRAHRVGQTREVDVVRLVTAGTIEEQIHALGETKLALDDRVAGEARAGDDAAGSGGGQKVEKQGEKMVAEMMAEELMQREGKKDEKETKVDAPTTSVTTTTATTEVGNTKTE